MNAKSYKEASVSFLSWICSSPVRLFPQSPAPRRAGASALEGALNEQFSFQVGMRLDDPQAMTVRCEVAAPAGWHVRVRRVGFVPVLHHNTPVPEASVDVDGRGAIPGLVPDPLLDEDSVTLGPQETHAFWVTLRPGLCAGPGLHKVVVTVHPDRYPKASHTIWVRLHDVVLGKRRGFPITQWFYVDALIDWYKTDLFDKRFWEILPAYMKDMVAHGQNSIYVPAFTPPLDGVKRPSQLLRMRKLAPHRYEFDWHDVKRYVALARRSGLEHFEWCHPFTQWGAKYAIRVYEGQGRDERRLWPPETLATSKTYRLFLSQYLPQLRNFLQREGILSRTFFHVSDEPHGAEHLANYRLARAQLRELAPWMKVMDALTEIDFARQELTDMPIPSISTALNFIKEGIPCWCYYCCGPRSRFLNRLLDTPLAKIAMHGFCFYRWPFRGFLHWGYNYWYQSQTRTLIDPYSVQDGLAWQRGWAYGDTFCVYPGPNGPVDSMRWEVFGESLQDYRLLQTLGVERDSRLLAPIRSFEDFPKTARWRAETRARILRSGRGA